MHIFSGNYKGRRLESPKGLNTRPTAGRLRQTLFNICQGSIEGTDFLDLFAGSGAMGFEALSQGANSATFVDSNLESIRCIRQNATALGVENQVKIYQIDVFKMLKKFAENKNSYGIIYVDPPYMSVENPHSLSVQVLRFIDQFYPDLIVKGGSLFLEDIVEALSEPITLTNLSLKSSRNMGKSTLQHYIHQ